MGRTSIQWTDFSSNPIRYRDAGGRDVWACVKVSAGCRGCYAEATALRFGKGGAFSPQNMAKLTPYLRDKEVKELLSPTKIPPGSKVFVGDMTDVFGEWVPFELLRQLFSVFNRRPDVLFQVLTKRPERMAELFTGLKCGGNVWLGTSVEDQGAADERIPHLLRVPAAVRFLSCEPLLGPVDLSEWMYTIEVQHDGDGRTREVPCRPPLDWVIAGGESGHEARPMHWRWAHSLRDQCQDAGVAFHFKQWGEWVSGVKSPADVAEGASQYRPGCYHDFDAHSMALKVGKKAAGRMLGGREWDEFPATARRNV